MKAIKPTTTLPSQLFWLFTGIIFPVFMISCSQKVYEAPRPSAGEVIDNITLDNGYLKQRQPWIVYSDREKNNVNLTPTGNEALSDYKKLKFLDPLIVLKRKNGMLKLAEYTPGAVNDWKISSKKSMKISGWVPEERLLLWNNSLKKSETGFALKAALVVNDADVLRNSNKYIENDSVIVFSSPDLISKTNTKVNLGHLVYIYKQSANNECFLVGDAPGFVIDSVKSHVYGWVSKRMVSVWGERAGVQFSETDSVQSRILTAKETADSINNQMVITTQNLGARTGFENIFPLQASNMPDSSWNMGVKYFTNALDYNANKIYNVLGHPVYYNKYREILANNRKLNIVFVLDMSQNNRLYLHITKSLLQEMQLNFSSSSYFSSIKFGGVVYKQNPCGVSTLTSALSANYSDVASFFDKKTREMQCDDDDIVQPVDKGLSSAASLLSGKEDETNIIILVGTTASPNQTQAAINALTGSEARAIIFQTQSKSADAYNNFVLLAEKAIGGSAANIAEFKKEKIINQQDLLVDNNYSLTEGEAGVYSLNYPKQSMTQGAVIFPKKGETMQARVLKNTFDSLLAQITSDNKKTDSTLTAYFRSSIGIGNTFLSKEYRNNFLFSDGLIPVSIASALLDQNASFLLNGYLSNELNPFHTGVEYGVLLNEQEYEWLQNYYTIISKKTLLDDDFNQRKAMRRYARALYGMQPTSKNTSRRGMRHKPMNEILKINTGYFSDDKNALMNSTLRSWKRTKTISVEKVFDFFEQHKMLADKLAVLKGDASLRINCNGQYFYWLTKDYIPIAKDTVSHK
ncbi:MAG: hypothetical protein LBE82_13915 [Chitinophagaceae bacterium]|jgi:hypothetical protein|nr:hypothetical protein [Chitinophagaceae bacterium]